MRNFILLALVCLYTHNTSGDTLQCHFCTNNPACSSGEFPGVLTNCKEDTDNFCFVYKTFGDPLLGEEPKFIKGCIEYGETGGGGGGGGMFDDIWPAEQHCITVTRPDTVGVPAGHGCKCLTDNCNYDLCTAANSFNPPAETSLREEPEGCRTINCQPCIFPFKYLGVEHSQCTTVHSDNGAPWCAVDIDEDGEATYGAWEDCDVGCPGMESSSSFSPPATTQTTTTSRPSTTSSSATPSKIINHFLIFTMMITAMK